MSSPDSVQYEIDPAEMCWGGSIRVAGSPPGVAVEIVYAGQEATNMRGSECATGSTSTAVP
jgi:hypothetical protein